MGRLYSLSFTEVAVTAQQDLFQIEAVTVPVVIHALYLSQTSDVGDAAAERLSILIQRVTDALANVSTAVKLDEGDGNDTVDINVNDTTELVTGVSIIHSEAWNIAMPFIYLPPPELRPVLQIGNVIVANLNTTPADSITMSGTLYWEEMGS